MTTISRTDQILVYQFSLADYQNHLHFVSVNFEPLGRGNTFHQNYVFPGGGTFIPYPGTLISSDMCPLPGTHIIPSVTVVTVVSVVTVSPVVTAIPILANGEVSQQVIHSGSQMVSHSVSKSANKSVGQSDSKMSVSNKLVSQQVSQSVH